MPKQFQIQPIGTVYKKDDAVWIEIQAPFLPGLLGLEQFSHIEVLYWFDQNDTPEMRATLQVHPMKDPANPLTGVFATHAPMRPNLIAITVCELLSVDDRRIRIRDIDARDGSPVIDIKCHIPRAPTGAEVRVPGWIEKGMQKS